MKIDLKKRLAGNRPAEEQDVRALKRALNWLGYYMPLETTGVPPIPDKRVFDALRQFQKEEDQLSVSFSIFWITKHLLNDCGKFEIDEQSYLMNCTRS